jgi:hypothetical protein
MLDVTNPVTPYFVLTCSPISNCNVQKSLFTPHVTPHQCIATFQRLVSTAPSVRTISWITKKQSVIEQRCTICSRQQYISTLLDNVHEIRKGRDGSVCIASHYGLDGPRIESRWGRDFPKPVQTDPWTHPASR